MRRLKLGFGILRKLVLARIGHEFELIHAWVKARTARALLQGLERIDPWLQHVGAIVTLEKEALKVCATNPNWAASPLSSEAIRNLLVESQIKS